MHIIMIDLHKTDLHYVHFWLFIYFVYRFSSIHPTTMCNRSNTSII